MRIDSCTVGPFQENCYLVVDEHSRRAVLVDPGDEGDRLVSMVEQSGATLEAMWITHGHLDHVGGIAAVRRAYDVPIYLHPADTLLYGEGAVMAAARYGVPFEPPPPADHALAEGQELQVGDLRFQVWHVPGHSPGHVWFLGNGVALGGDLLFAGSIGRTDLPLCDGVAMQRSLERVATNAPPETVVYPGHGPTTTVREELASNPFLSGIARPVRR